MGAGGPLARTLEGGVARTLQGGVARPPGFSRKGGEAPGRGCGLH